MNKTKGLKMTETMLTQMPREDVVSGFAFLDALRESGEANMFTEAGQYLQANHDFSRAETRAVHMAWMKSFAKDKTAEERADAILSQSQEGKHP
jgi:hypothetical protein